jgi:hypothetical protein
MKTLASFKLFADQRAGKVYVLKRRQLKTKRLKFRDLPFKHKSSLKKTFIRNDRRKKLMKTLA